MMKRLLLLATILAGMIVMDSTADARWGRRGWYGRGFYGPRASLRVGAPYRRAYYRGYYGAPVGYYAPAPAYYGGPAYYSAPVYGGYYGGGYYGSSYCW
jgi:hypothetical protein